MTYKDDIAKIKVALNKAKESINSLQRIEKIASEKGAGAARQKANNTKQYLIMIENYIYDMERK
jgi:hypothetical protein|tara:strand:- start:426 stop:617 length:192 start_codon:yes stop_codon:yes gene_type:complete